MVGDRVDALIILAIVAASGLVGFWQESSADRAVEELLRRVAVRVTALRDGAEREVVAEDLVPGDVVLLAAGSVVLVEGPDGGRRRLTKGALASVLVPSNI